MPREKPSPTTGASNFTYTYDDSGRITEVRAGGVLRYKYVYDESGQVATDYNFTKNTATKYVYDANGNIIQKMPYTNVTSSDLSTATQGTAINYTYDSEWGDKLVSYNGQSIVYDSIGNPTTYRGATLTWTGRMLTSFEKMSGDKLQRYEYSYDKDGLRTVKKYFEDGILQTVTTYLWKDGKLLGANVIDENGSILMTVKYIYDGEELVAIDLNGSVLLVEKNLQGDITSLYDVENDQKLFDFYYDAYGKMSVSQEDSFIVTIVKALIVAYTNVTYRGYYYDFETGLYYLQSRYYDPQTGRFISLDDTQIAIDTTGEPLGSNLYAYCYNNPVNTSDPTGEQPFAGWIVQNIAKSTILYKTFCVITRYNKFSWAFDLAGFTMDKDGVYHAKFDCWQAVAGYNDLYDFVFNIATSMKRQKLEFDYGGKDYVIWAWKGDYYNLGAGGEVGIYEKRSERPEHWIVNKSLAMEMGLNVFYHKNFKSSRDILEDNLIITYAPDEKQWWITGFNPRYKNKSEKDLYLMCGMTFNNWGMYKAFKDSFDRGKKNTNKLDQTEFIDVHKFAIIAY